MWLVPTPQMKDKRLALFFPGTESGTTTQGLVPLL